MDQLGARLFEESARVAGGRVTVQAADTATGSRSVIREFLVDALHLFVLSSFAVAQPLFAVFQNAPQFFVARRSEADDLIAFAAVVLVAPPLVAVALEGIAWLAGATWRRRVHLGLVGLFFGLITLQLIGRVQPVDERVAVLLGVIAGAGFAALYTRVTYTRQLLTIGVFAPPLFLATFLFTRPVSAFVLGRQAAPPPPAIINVKPPVVFVVFDEFPVFALLDRNGELNARRFPNIAELARRSTWFRHVGSAHPLTQWAVPAIMSGIEPEEARLPDFNDYPNNLFTLLRNSYDLHITEPVTNLCPEAVCGQARPARPGRPQRPPPPPPPPLRARVFSLVDVTRALYPRMVLPGRYPGYTAGMEDPFGEFLGTPGSRDTAVGEEEQDQAPPPPLPSPVPGTTTGPQFAERVATEFGNDRTQRFRSFVSQIDARDEQLYFLHVLLPHLPYQYLPSGRRYNEAPIAGMRDGSWEPQGDWYTRLAEQRLLLQLGHVDRLVGELTARLQRLGIYDKSLVVVTADHGMSFLPGEPSRLVNDANKYEVGLVPLFIKAPHQEDGRVFDGYIQSVDILPTVAGLLGTAPSFPTDGQNMLAPGVTGRPQLRMRQHRSRDFVILDDPRGGVRAAALRLAERLGDGSSALDPFDFGPDRDLIVRRLQQLPVVGDSGLVAALDDASVYGAVSLASGVVPSHVRGTLRGPVRPDMQVAIAVNGTVGAVAPVVESTPEGARFAAMVPEWLFAEGPNIVTLLAVTGGGPARRIEPIALVASLGDAPPGDLINAGIDAPG